MWPHLPLTACHVIWAPTTQGMDASSACYCSQFSFLSQEWPPLSQGVLTAFGITHLLASCGHSPGIFSQVLRFIQWPEILVGKVWGRRQGKGWWKEEKKRAHGRDSWKLWKNACLTISLSPWEAFLSFRNVQNLRRQCVNLVLIVSLLSRTEHEKENVSSLCTLQIPWSAIGWQLGVLGKKMDRAPSLQYISTRQ